MDQAAKDAYVTVVLNAYDAANADGRLDIVMKEFYLAAWGNGLEAYNIFRRTGKPNNMMPPLEPASGNFPQSFFYPAVSIDRNSSIQQKSGINVPVFWMDSGIASGLY